MRYVEARLDEYQREEAYRIYISNSLQLAPQQKYIKSTYADVIESLNKPQEPPKSAEEIVLDIMSRAQLKFGD